MLYLNYLDYIIIGIVAFFAVRGLLKGFFRVFLGFFSLIVGYILAIKFMANMSSLLDRVIDVPPGLLSLLGFLIIFIAVILGFQIVIHFFQSVVKLAHLGWLDKLAGVAIGALKGAVIASMLIMLSSLLISFLPFNDALIRVQKDSLLYKPIRSLAPLMYDSFAKLTPNAKSFYGELTESMGSIPSFGLGSQTNGLLDSLQGDETSQDDSSENEQPRRAQ